ncbi:MAG TPA: carboxypeptidase-like regulatory domain-containing protein, partial [Planctomycetota bacterium]|nr:carboxypeptidase-like regulatory domain-containing protein [Planctomycetota bacterium]
SIRRRFDVQYFLERSEVLASGSRLVGGRPATWTTGRTKILMTDPGEFLVVTLNAIDALYGSPPQFLSLVKSPDGVSAHRATFEQVLDSVRFPGAIGEVEGVELTERDVGSLRGGPLSNGSVRVLVVRGDRPLPGATVDLYAPDEERPWTSSATDDKGEVHVASGAAARTARIRVRASGVSERWWGGAPTEFQYRLVCVVGTRSISGRAYDAIGLPIPSGHVGLRPITGPRWTTTTSTDAGGDYALEGLVAGQYELVAAQSGDGSAGTVVRNEPVQLRARDVMAHVDLGSDAPDVPWRFSVRLASGTPVSPGYILFLTRDEAGVSTRMLHLGADGGGTVNLPPGRWRAIGLEQVATVGGGPGETIWSIPGVRVAGTVRGLDVGENAVVECRTAGRTARVGADAFSLDGVSTGPHLLSVRVGDRTSAPREVVVPEDRDLTGVELSAP